MAYTYGGIRYETYNEASAAMRAKGTTGIGKTPSKPKTETTPEPETETDTVGAVGSLIEMSRPGPLQSNVMQKHWLYNRNIQRPRRSWM